MARRTAADVGMSERVVSSLACGWLRRRRRRVRCPLDSRSRRAMASLTAMGVGMSELGRQGAGATKRPPRPVPTARVANHGIPRDWQDRSVVAKKCPRCSPNRSKLCPIFLRKTFTLVRNIGPFDTEVRTRLPNQAVPRRLSHPCLPCAGRRRKILRARSPRPFPTRGSAPARA